MINDADIDLLLKKFDEARHDINVFMKGVIDYMADHPALSSREGGIIHSYKSRIKDREHLRQKIKRKIADGVEINEGNFFDKITDLAGVRILHLFQEQYSDIDFVIRKRVEAGDWHLAERPKAYTWDPETVRYFAEFDLNVAEKSTSYTSVHYLLKPRQDSYIHCEMQVRTLFEEIWGEVDHQINYPQPSTSIACREQIKVLSKIVGAGSRLLDSLRRVHTAEQ